MPTNTEVAQALMAPQVPTEAQKAEALRNAMAAKALHNAYMAKILDPVNKPSLLAPNSGLYSDQPTDQDLLRQRQQSGGYWAYDLNNLQKQMENSLGSHTDYTNFSAPKSI
jgi:hypothetical protein